MPRPPSKSPNQNLPVPTRRSVVQAPIEGRVEAAPESFDTPFVSFQYAYSEISMVGGRAHVKSRRASLTDGKLESESFEGELDRRAYDRAISQAQQHFAAQTELFLRSLSLLFPRRR
jgi:hypothetical protein